MILVIDNYDSFTWNLVHYLMELGAVVEVVRNDAMSAGQALSSGAEAFLISPGPCTPNEAGISLDLVAACADAGTPLRSEEHTSALQSLMHISYAVFCLKTKMTTTTH